MTSSDDLRALYYYSPDIRTPQLHDTAYSDTSASEDEKKGYRISINSMESSELSSIHEEEELLSPEEQDLEAQKSAQPATTQPAEYAVSTSKKLTYLGLYFLLNLGVTLSNKALLRSVGRSSLLSYVVMC